MARQDFIGNRGQSIAHMRLTDMCRKNGLPYFEAHFLGDKCQTFDFLVELVGAGQRRPYFFVQVKASQRGFTNTTPPRLRVKVSKSDVLKMVLFQAPTYVIGVDEPRGQAYVIAVFGNMSEGIGSLSTQHQLNPGTLRYLWEEVREFWKTYHLHQHQSRFVN
jgi:hypothetical protein